MLVGRAGNLIRRPGSTYLGNAFGAGNFNYEENPDAKLFSWQRDVDDGYVLAYSGNDITLFRQGTQLTNVASTSTQLGAPARVLFGDANTGFTSTRPDLATFASVADIGYFAPYPEADGVHRLYSVQRKVTATLDEELFTDRTDVQGVTFPAQSVVFTDGPYERFNVREDATVHFRTTKNTSDPITEHPLDGHGSHSLPLGADVGDFGWIVFTSQQLAAVNEYIEEHLGSFDFDEVYPYTDRLICIEQTNPDTSKIERGVGKILTFPTRLESLNSGAYNWYGIGVQVIKPFVDKSATSAANVEGVDSFAVSIPFHEGFNTFTFHQDRLYFSVKNKPNRLYASTTAGYSSALPNLTFSMTDKPDGMLTSFAVGLECSPSDPLDVLNVRDTDGLDFGLTAGDLGDITSLVSDARGLLAFTESEAFLVSGGGALSAITPTNVIAVRQSNFGVQLGTNAVQADKSVLFIQDGGLVLRETGYEFNSDRFLSRNLSFLAEHLLKYQSDAGQRSNVRELVLQRSPETRFLMRRGDGKGVSLSFQPDEGLLAFSLTEFGTASSTTLFDAGLNDDPPFSSQIVSQTVIREDNKERLYQLVKRRKQQIIRSDSQFELDYEVVISDLEFGLDESINQLFLDSKTTFDNRLNVTAIEMHDASNAQLKLTFDSNSSITTPTAGTVVVCRNLDSVRSGVPAKFANTRYTVVSESANTMIVQLERGGSFDEAEFSLPATNVQATVGAIQTTLTGLTRFEDASVSVCQGEQLLGSFTVSSGQIDLRQDTDLNPVRSEHLLTDVVTVGLPFNSRIKTVPVATLRSSSRQFRDNRSDQTRIYKIYMRLIDTFGGSAGGVRTTPILYRKESDFTNAPFKFTGVLEHSVVDSSELGTTIQVETTDPYNFEMTALYMQVDRGGIS